MSVTQTVTSVWRDYPSVVKGFLGLTMGVAIEDVLPWLSAIVFLLTITNLSIELHRKLTRKKRDKDSSSNGS